jgi:hypothetical protein
MSFSCRFHLNDAAKVRINIEKTKFLSSEIKEKLVFAMMSREKIL